MSAEIAAGEWRFETGDWPLFRGRAVKTRGHDLNRRIFARLPQSRMSHQRRDRFLLRSRNSQPQLSLAHSRSRVLSGDNKRSHAEARFSKDDLLALASLYWFTEAIGSSMRM